MTNRCALDTNKKTHLHPLTVTAALQPFCQLESVFREEEISGYKTGFLDAPSYSPSGNMYQWISDDDEIWTMSSVVMTRSN